MDMIREQIAGGKTVAYGHGYGGDIWVYQFFERLRCCSAYGWRYLGISKKFIERLQRCCKCKMETLFMPDVVEKQQDGFKLESFVYRKMPAVRFIGKDERDVPDMEARSRAHSVSVRNGGVFSYIQALINAAAQVLGEVAIDFFVDLALLFESVDDHFAHKNPSHSC